MDPNQTTQHAPEEFRSLMQDDRAYSSSPTWRVSVQPRATIIGVRSVWTLGTVHSFLFTGLGFGLYFARAWFDLSEDVGQFLAIAAWVCWSLAGLFLFGVIGVQICRSKEDWFVCRPLEQTVSCPRLERSSGSTTS